MRTGSVICALFLSTVLVFGQVRIDAPVHLVGPSTTDRQVLGVPAATNANDMLNAGDEQRGVYRTGQVASDWSVSIPMLTEAPGSGTQLNLIAPAVSTGPVSVFVNGNGPFSIQHAPGLPMQGDHFTEGTPFSVVFDGTSFQLLQGSVHRRRPCPEGMVAVNDQYCIDILEAAENTSYYAAVLQCGTQGLRLCSWAEFHAACMRSSELGLVGMTGNWEWTYDAANENGSARVVGYPSCSSASTGNANANWRPRCCASR